jgi:hypothetical protein
MRIKGNPITQVGLVFIGIFIVWAVGTLITTKNIDAALSMIAIEAILGVMGMFMLMVGSLCDTWDKNDQSQIGYSQAKFEAPANNCGNCLVRVKLEHIDDWWERL